MDTNEYLARLIEDFASKNDYSVEEKEELLVVISKLMKFNEEELSEENIINIIINK